MSKSRGKRYKIIFTTICMLAVLFTYTGKLSTVYAAASVTRGEWMQALVDTFDMTIEDGVVPDDYYGDISTSQYYESILIAMNFGVIDLEPGEDFEPESAVTREFAAQTLNYCLGFQLDADAQYTMSDKAELTYPQDAQIALNRNWFTLTEGKFLPETEITLSEKNAMLSDAEKVWESTKIDPDYKNSYTFADGVIEVPEETEVTIGEDNKVTIIDCPVTIEKNDSFVVYNNGIAYVYKANDIAKNKNDLVIEAEELDYEENVESTDAQGEIEADLAEAVPLSDGITIITENDSEMVTMAARKTKKIKPITVKANIDGVQLTCKISNIKVEYINNFSEKYLGVKGKGSITASTKAKKSLSIPLVKVPITGVGSVTVSAEYSITGSISLIYTTNFVIGVSYTKMDGFRTVKEFSKETFSYSAKVDAQTGFRIAFSASIPWIASGMVYGDTGINGIVDVESYKDGKKPEVCMDLMAYFYASVGYNVKFLGIKSWNDSYKVYDYNNSPIRLCYHVEDGVEVDSCTRGRTTSSGRKRKYYTSKYSGTGSGSSGRTTISSYCDSGFIADDTVTVYQYTLDEENNATITKYNGNAQCLVIPETIDGYTVTAIGSNAFANNTYLRSVVIPDTVTNIGSSAFYKCNNLKDVDLPINLVSLGSAAFNYTAIEEITIPKSLEKVGSVIISSQYWGPFGGCEKLKKVNYETGITKIPIWLFAGCGGLESIIIPDTVTEIGNYAFEYCENLQQVKIPDNVTTIGDRVFYMCSNLKDVDLSTNLVSLGSSAFSCTAIEEITIPKSLEKVGAIIMNPQYWGPFGGCEKLKKINYETGITKIPIWLFAGCGGLESIIIPDTVTEIGNYAFEYCENLQQVKIPDNVTIIGDSVFYKCNNLKDVDLPINLVSLGSCAFSCTAIEEITIPKSLEKVGAITMSPQYWGAFGGCEKLKKVNYETGITKIPIWLFAGCGGLESIIIPDTVTEIGNSAFEYCENLQQVKIPDNVTTIGDSVFYKCIRLTQIEIPDTVTDMGTFVFSGCTSLQKVHISNISKNIPNDTFSNCSALSEVNLPDTLETIGTNAFKNCTSLAEINLPEKVDIINSSAFSGCTSLTKVTIPASMRKIYSNAFSHCEALSDLNISEGTTEIGSNAFEYCKTLQSVILPDSLQTLGSYAFQYCDVLSDVNIGAGLRVIPSYCFYENPALKELILPQQVTTVNKYAFGNCTKFTDITMNRRVSSIESNAFSYPDKLTIHGVSETYPETFATENGIDFVPLNVSATAIKLNKTECRVARGYTLQLTAGITPADSSDELTWTSNDEDIVTVDDNGLIKGIKNGTAEILVMAGDVVESCQVTVYEKVISVYLDTDSAELSIGDTLQLKATIYPSDADNKNVSWSTSDETVATVDNTGLVTAKAYGTAKITVTTEDSGYTRTCTVSVKPIAVTGVTLNAKTAVVGVGGSYQLIPIISPENASIKDVTWTSSKTAVATVENGLVTGVSEGTAVIIVKTTDGSKTATCTVTVKKLSVTGVSLDKTELEMKTGETYQLTENIEPLEAGNRAVTWSSDNETVAVVNNGKITAKKAGTAKITVTTEDGGYTATCMVTVTGHTVTGITLSKEEISIEKGMFALLEAFVEPENADDKSVTWESDNGQIVKVKSTGVLEAVAVGEATVKAVTVDGNYEANCRVTVTEAENPEEKVHVEEVTIKPEDEEIEGSIKIGEPLKLTANILPVEADNKNIIWLSSNKEIAEIDQQGNVTPISIGEVVFTAISEDGGVSASYTLEVLPVMVTGVTLIPNEQELYIGDKQTLTVNILPENATNKNVVWSSNAPGVAVVSQAGVVTAVRVGTAKITVTTEDGEFQATCTVTVKPILVSTITVTPVSLSLKMGEEASLTVTVKPDDATDKSIEWSSNNTSIATVDERGNVIACGEGTTTITAFALDGSGVSESCMITVKRVEVGIVDPNKPTQPVSPALPDKPVAPSTEGNQEGDFQGSSEVFPTAGTKITISSGVYKVIKATNVKKEVIFIKPKSKKKTNITIPATVSINGRIYKVTEIASKAFKNNKKLKSVTIGKNVKKIGKEAFYGCKKLKKITIKSAILKSVGKNAIKNIYKKATIKCPKKQLKKYKKLFKSKTGYKKTMKIKK